MRGRRGAVVLAFAAVLLAGCGGNAPTARATPSPSASPSPSPTPSPTPAPTPTPTPPAPLFPPGTALHAGPLATPLRFRAPSVAIDLAVLAVGLTKQNAMDAPEGSPNDPVWHEAFWYRGGSDPGMPGTTTIAGHLDDTLGRPGGFWNIRRLAVGDIVEIADGRDGTVDRYRISEVDTMSLAQANTPAVLTRLYGEAAATGDTSKRDTASDGVSRISLITCTGTWRGSAGYDHRYLAFGELVATVTPSPSPVAQ